MGERRRGESGEPATGFPVESEEPSSLLQQAVSVLQSSSLDSSSQHGFQFSKAILVENDLFLSELKAFARAKEAAGYSQEELQETFAFLLFDKEEEAKEVCQSGLRVNSSSISTLGDPAKGVYISKYSDCLQPRPWHPGKSGYIVICKLIKGKVRAIAENSTSSFTCPSPGYDCHVSNHSPSRSSQYYVYEVSGGSTAERPRQVCPYIFLVCQYREPKEMPVLATHSLAEQSHQDLYCPWRGQLSIQGQLLCTIALRNPYSSTIPAQLPPNLDVNHVMGLADLKKKLPEAAFGKKNYTGNEVCFQGVYSSLYEVEISNKDQSKMDQLVEKLKEKDLAIIKYLQDQGVLILLTSSALAREEGLDPKEPVTLLALFLFPSPRALSPPAKKQAPKDGKGSNGKNSISLKKENNSRNSISLKITSVLPGLRYALRKAADSSCYSTGIKEHLQEYAKLQENSDGKKIPIPSVPSAWQDDEGVHHHPPPSSQKISERSLGQLRHYLCDPSSYTLAISAALGWLSGAGRNLGADPNSSSSSPHANLSSPPRGIPAPDPFLDNFSKSVTSPTKPWGRENRRKSSRILGKNLSPLKAQTNPEGEDSKSKETAKKKIPLASSCPQKSGSGSEPMLKLANLRLPHGRKRGAEVLAAEIVHKPQCEGEEKESSAAPNGGEAKKPKTLENSDTKKNPGAESGTKAGKNKPQKNEEDKAATTPENQQEQSGLKEPLPDLPSESSSSSSSQSQGAATPRNEINPMGIPRNEIYPLTIPTIQRTEINSLTIPAVPRNEIVPLAIPGIQRNEINPLTIPGITINPLTIPGNPLAIPAIPRNEINLLTIPGVPRNEINLLTIPGVPRNEINPLTIPGVPGNEINPLTIPGVPRNEINPLTIPTIPGNSLTIPSLGFALQGPNSESHALNLLADLALGSCIPALIPKDSGIILLESRDSNPQSLPVASDHKYHMADKQENQKKPTLSNNKTSLNQQNLRKKDPKDDPPTEKTSGILPAAFQVFPAREAAEVNKHSIISDEHSYASPMPDDPKTPSDPKGKPKGNPNPGLTPPKTNCRNVPSAPLVGKVLPFRHHHSNTSEPAQSRGWGRKKEEFSRRHTVTVSGNSLKVTCGWEEEYLFHLDSRYTNDPLEKTVIRALHGPWDPNLPDDVEGMKLILHMWVALFYRKPSKLLSSSRKVVEHINPKKFVSINSSGAFLELSDDSQDCFGLETCPADSAWDPDQTPSSSLDPSNPSQGSLDPSNPPSSSLDPSLPSQGSLDPSNPPSSSLDPSNPSQGSLDPSNPPSSSLDPSTPPSSSLDPSLPSQGSLDHSTPPSSSLDPSLPSQGSLDPSLPSQASLDPSTPPSSSLDPSLPSQGSSQADKEHSQTFPADSQTDADGTPGDSTVSSSSGELPCGEEEEPSSTSCAEGLSLQDHSREKLEVEHREPQDIPQECAHGVCSNTAEKEEENEEFEDEGSFQGPVDLVLSESSDAEMECEQNPGNSASPEEFDVPEEEPVATPTSLASPCTHRSSPALSAGAGNDPGDDPQEMSPHQDELPDPWDTPGTPDSDPDGLGAAEVGSPHSSSGELLFPPEASPARGAQPDSRMDSPAPAGDTLGCSEQENRDRAPSGERWEPAGSTESPCGQGMSLALSPDSSSVCLTSPDGSLDPWAAPEDQPMDSIQSPTQSELGRSSCLSQLGGDEADPDLNSLDNEESNQGGNEVLGEEEQGSPCAKAMEELDDPVGAGDDLGDSPLDYPATGDECRAEEREDEFPEAGNSPGDDRSNMEMEPEIPFQQTDGEFLPESEPSSSIREGISAIQELPRQQQSFPNIPGDSAPALGDSNPGIPSIPSRRQSVLCRLWRPCREGGAAQLSVPAWSLDCSLNPSCSRELIPSPAPCSPRDELGPAELGSAPPSPCDPWADAEAAEPLPEGLPGEFPPSPNSWSQSCDSPGNSRGSPEEEPCPPEDLGTGSVPSPAPFPSWECRLCEPWDECEHNPEGSQPFPDPDCADTEVGEGEIPNSPIPASPWDEHRDLPGEHLEFSDAEDIPEQLPSQDTHEGLAFEDPLDNSFGDSEQEYFEGNSRSPLPSRNSCIMRSMDAAGARTNRDSSSRSSLHTEEHGEDWDWEISRDPGSSVLSRQCQERMENSQLPKKHQHRSRESHLARSLMGTWRSFEEITQNTLDMECLRFHYKLKEILRNGKPSFSTSKSIFPTHLPPHSAPIPPSPRSRSPLQVTIPSSDTWPHRDTWASSRGRSRARSRDPGAPFHLGKLRYHRMPPEPRRDISSILDEYSHFQRVVLGRAQAGRDPPGPSQAGKGQAGPEPFQGMMVELRGALRSHLRRVAAAAQPGMFFLLETGKEPLFDRVKALLKARGFVRTEPPSFLRAQRRERLLVIVRNEDISSHIHTVPSLLELKRCPSVVFAGVDDPEEVTGNTFQELFQAGGFVVSDEELLERVTLGQLKEVLKVLEKLNRNGRWKWLLHHRESRKLRGDLRDDAQKKQLLLRRCQGEELLELLPFHTCDSTTAGPRRVPCLLELQVQHIHARFAVYLTENPGSSREILESKGILVADINTFLGTVQELAAPFRRSYW
ncbi:protein TASOR 2 [Sylvia borin]